MNADQARYSTATAIARRESGDFDEINYADVMSHIANALRAGNYEVAVVATPAVAARLEEQGYVLLGYTEGLPMVTVSWAPPAPPEEETPQETP